MTCPARNPKLSPSACPAHILGIADGREIQHCRACPHGLALMATVKQTAILSEPDVLNSQHLEGELMEKQMYTIRELAALLGVSPKDVANAKNAKSKNPMPGTKIATVRDGMSASGITWEQVASGKYAKNARVEEMANAKRAPMRNAASTEPAPSQDSAQTAETADIPPFADELEAAFADTLAAMESEDAQYLPDAGSLPIGVDMSLEDVLGKLRRLLPGATLSIPL